MRGNQYQGDQYQAILRSIPACAGEPTSPNVSDPPTWVYPRVCGGTFTAATRYSYIWGLSPRVRGNPRDQHDDQHIHRSIPACAGEPPCRAFPRGLSAVYPRVCGGTPKSLAIFSAPVGLSPRVRGNRLRSYPLEHDSGSIPACAGEPRSPNSSGISRRVYPRVCGGTRDGRRGRRGMRGLSPRVRGNLASGGAEPNNNGSIPACAGEPRWGGVIKHRKGLSPRVRGNPLLPAELRFGFGSIPACAGEPFQPTADCLAWGVYPRVCGGTVPSSLPVGSPQGLSPRVRGNLRLLGEEW